MATSSKAVTKQRSIWSSPVRRREAINGYVFILPWLIGLVVFTVGPIVAGLYFSLTKYDIITPAKWVGFDNYKTVFFDDEKFWLMVGNTVYYVAFSVLPRVALALLLAMLLNAKVRGVTIFRTLFYMPSIVPTVAGFVVFIIVLHDRFGLLNEFLYRVLGIIGPNWLTSPDWAKISLILWSLWGLGGSVIIYLAALQGVPEALYESASIDGAGSIRRFFSITIPMISPTLFFVTVMGFIAAFQVFAPSFLISGEGGSAATVRGPMNSLLFWVVYLYDSAFIYFRMGYASALAWLLFLVLVVLTIGQFRISRLWVYYEGDE